MDELYMVGFKEVSDNWCNYIKIGVFFSSVEPSIQLLQRFDFADKEDTCYNTAESCESCSGIRVKDFQCQKLDFEEIDCLPEIIDEFSKRFPEQFNFKRYICHDVKSLI